MSPSRRLVLPLLIVAAAAVAVTAPAAAATRISPMSSSTKYHLVTEPADKYQQIYSLINSARTTLDMTMYELTDTTAEHDLANAAARGVTVRVILDVNREKSHNTTAYNYLNANGVPTVWAATKYAATHQKTITIDDVESAIMSGNLTSQYYATSRDFAVLDTNLIDVHAIEKVFNADYTGATITPGDGDNLTWSPTDSQTSLLSVINSATSTLQVENEEMADPAVTNALVAKAKAGVGVKITMTANSSYDSAFDQLKAAGAQIHLYPNNSTALYIHAKVILADSALSTHTSYVGSINFSDASLNKNRELGFITHDDTITSGLASALTSDFNGGTAY
jgi:phosphatidylserine/phosphatidylglycerophosphate/cardiolipin synthase-like enzyme